MSHPSNPPPYDAAYTQGVHTQQPQPQVILQVPQQHVAYRNVAVDNSMAIGPSTIVCPTCRYTVQTRIEIRPALRTHLCAFCLFFIGFWPCCLIPYCMPSCNNVDHFCPKCNSFVGAYRA